MIPSYSILILMEIYYFKTFNIWSFKVHLQLNEYKYLKNIAREIVSSNKIGFLRARNQLGKEVAAGSVL